MNELALYAPFVKEIKALIYRRQNEITRRRFSDWISICKSKNRTRVEYTLKNANVLIGVATDSTHANLPENI